MTAQNIELRLYNTLTRSKETFVPIDAENVRMYVCGPTVYDFAHIGNARPVIVFDILFRLLRHVYGENHVTYARNITDVDDKINARAVRDYPDLPFNEAIRKVTESTNAQFQADVTALGNLAPTEQPRATDHMDEMRALIDRLVARGVAYVADDHVLFSPSAMNEKAGSGYGARYGALARRSLDEMLAGARVDVASYKRDEMDFVLWKPSKQGEPGWPSPAGIAVNGRPGWHIECSAMAMAKLLEPFGAGLQCDDPEKNIFDIHAGGIDLVFPHHENEIAQTCCAFDTERMANIWMHNGFLQVEGQKMSKSLGNFYTIRELLDTEAFGGRKWSGKVLRLAMLMTHYREPIDFSVSRLYEAEDRLNKWLRGINDRGNPKNGVVDQHVIMALSNDLDVSNMLVAMDALSSNLFSEDHALREKTKNDIAATLKWLGLAEDSDFPEIEQDESRREAIEAAYLVNNGIKITKAEIEKRVASRLALIAAKNWQEADRIRDALLADGIQLKDGKDAVSGERITTWEVVR